MPRSRPQTVLIGLQAVEIPVNPPVVLGDRLGFDPLEAGAVELSIQILSHLVPG